MGEQDEDEGAKRIRKERASSKSKKKMKEQYEHCGSR